MLRGTGSVLVLALAALAACTLVDADEGDRRKPKPKGPPPLRIAATTQSLGNLEPCNCVEGMLGGYPRRLAALKRARKRGPLLVLDGGDLTGKGFHPRLLEAKTRAALELLKEAKAVAVAVGERDLRLGATTLTRLARAAGVTLLGANITDADGKRPFAASQLTQIAGQQVLVIGVLDPGLGDPTGELDLGDPVKAVRAALATAPRGAQVIVLFHGSAKAAAPLASVQGIDGVICGHDQQTATPLSKVGSAWRVEAIRDARSIAFVSLGPRPALTRQNLGADVPDDPFTRARVERYYRDVRGLPEPKRKPTPAGGRFVGRSACADCHLAAVDAFKTTKHYLSHPRILKKDKKRANLTECVGCHVTGHGYQGGFVDLTKTPELGEVSCEACHGVGGNHVAAIQNGLGGRGYGVKAGFPNSWKPVCVGCHDASNSPKFDFKAAMAKIKHWKGRGD